MHPEEELEPAENFPQKELPFAQASLVLGIISVAGVVFFQSTGFVCGIVGLVLAYSDRKLYLANPGKYLASSCKHSNIGRICAIVGVSLSVIAFIAVAAMVLG